MAKLLVKAVLSTLPNVANDGQLYCEQNPAYRPTCHQIRLCLGWLRRVLWVSSLRGFRLAGGIDGPRLRSSKSRATANKRLGDGSDRIRPVKRRPGPAHG